MVTQENLVSSLSPSPSSPSISLQPMPDLGRRVSKMHHPASPVETSRRIQAFTDRYLGPVLSSSASALGSGGDFLSSDLPAAFGLSPKKQMVGEDLGGLDQMESGGSLNARTLGWSVEQVLGVVAVGVIVPFILVSNLLVVVSVVRFKRLQMPTNFFIVSLAAVDIFVALVTPFFIVVEILPGQVENPILCLSPNRILMTACGVSVLTMAAIAYDRHTALVSPLKYVSVMTLRRILVVVTSVWLYSAAIVWTPVLLGWFSTRSTITATTSETLETVHPCSFQLLHDKAHVLFLGAIFGPACLAITLCYFRIYTVARQHARAIAAVESSVHHNLRVRFMIRDAKYAKTLAMVIGVFLLLWTPYLACLLAEVISSVHISPWLWNYLTLLAVLNSGLNPWIYAFKNNDFRTAFCRILKACCSVCCRMGGRRCCSQFFKDSRRSSSLSGVNIFTTTTTTSTNQSRSSRSSHGSMTASGRLSDLSCVISAGVENVSKVFNANRRRTLASSISAANSASGEKDAILHSIAESTEKRVSTLLNADSRAFIEDLLSLYVHHSLVHRDADVDTESVAEDSDLDDHNGSLSADPGGHGEPHRSDLTGHLYPGHPPDPACGYPCDPAEDLYDRDHMYHGGPHTEVFHSDTADDVSHSDHAYHSDHTDDTYHSDHAHETDSDHQDPGDPSHLNHHHHTDDFARGGDTDLPSPGDTNHYSYHGNSRDCGHLGDLSDHIGGGGGGVGFKDLVHKDDGNDGAIDTMCYADHTEHHCYIDLTSHGPFGDHTDRGYHSDHSDCVELDCLSVSPR